MSGTLLGPRPERARRGLTRRPRRRLWVLAVAAMVLTVVATGLLLLEPLRVSSGSMAPTLQAGDQILVGRGPLGPGTPERGDVVVLRVPDEDGLAVKRVAALGGDRLAVRDGHLVVNGRRVAEPWLDHDRVDGTYLGPVRVPAGTVYVLGDNRSDSRDSRDFGPVPTGDLEGRVLARWHPRR